MDPLDEVLDKSDLDVVPALVLGLDVAPDTLDPDLGEVLDMDPGEALGKSDLEPDVGMDLGLGVVQGMDLGVAPDTDTVPDVGMDMEPDVESAADKPSARIHDRCRRCIRTDKRPDADTVAGTASDDSRPKYRECRPWHNHRHREGSSP